MDKRIADDTARLPHDPVGIAAKRCGKAKSETSALPGLGVSNVQLSETVRLSVR
ncbi:MAG: hypothetical protein IPO97_00470 [Sphingomonadales bacterium]|nr:hypothetical protein [Sphingomonadales bacterium]